MHTQTESVLGRVSQQLSHLEKRDWELWVIVSLAGLLVGAGLLAILLPAAFLKQDNIHFEVTVSRPLVLGLVALLARSTLTSYQNVMKFVEYAKS